VPIGQLNNELEISLSEMDFSDDFQRLTIEGVMRGSDANTLYVRMMQYLVLLVDVTNGTNAAAFC
jgi:hypothetical protein